MQNKKMLPLTDRRALVVYLQEMRYRRIAFQNFRWAYNMDGIDDRWTLANEVNLSGDWYIEVTCNLSARATGQDILNKELFCKISMDAAGRYTLLVGNGTGWVVTLPEPDGINQGKVCVIRGEKVGNTYRLMVNGVLRSHVTNASTVTPALSHVGVRSTLLPASHVKGLIYNVNINGTLWPMADRNQAVQPSIPAGNNMTGVNLNPDRWVEISK